MVTAQHILDLAERYGRSQNISLITVSSRVFSDSKKLDAIKNSGADLTLKRAGTALEWFSDNWPDDCEWPKEIQRPDPQTHSRVHKGSVAHGDAA